MSVLIVTEPDDVHAVLVQLALKEKKVACDLFFSADMPTKQENSLVINKNELLWNSSSLKECSRELSSSSYTAIWWRRPRKPFIPNEVHPDDRKFINLENYAFFESIPQFFAEQIWWVNPVSGMNKIKSKPYQLKLARECGLHVPTTLISNSPRDIEQFIREAGEQPVIYKSFTPHFWNDAHGVNIAYTHKIQLEDLPSNRMLQIVPGIYQHYIEKSYELRITCFGSYLSAIKIDSQKNDRSRTDWRKSSEYDLGLAEVAVPDYLRKLIHLYMNKMGIVFGCFDFIVTPKGEYFFLEVNEQGQFLWVEDVLPHIHYLDIFCNFLLQRSFDFNWTPHKNRLYSADYDDEAKAIVNRNIGKHIHLNAMRSVP